MGSLDDADPLSKFMQDRVDDQRGVEALRPYVEASADSPNFVLGFRKDTGAFAVATGLGASEHEADVYELGYWVARDQQGLGFATEASNALIRHAFGPLGAKAVTLGYYEGNQASANVVRKLGFPFVRTGIGERYRCLDGSPVDVHFRRRTNADGLPAL
jgi:RimJ/RimL family protein N-acetyltransferase